MNLKNLSELCVPLPGWLMCASAFCLLMHVFIQCTRKGEILEKKTLLFRLSINLAAISFVMMCWNLTFEVLAEESEMFVALLISSIVISILMITAAVWNFVAWTKNRKKKITETKTKNQYQVPAAHIMGFDFPFPAKEIGGDDITVYVECTIVDINTVAYDAWVSFTQGFRVLALSGVFRISPVSQNTFELYDEAMTKLAKELNRYKDELYDVLAHCDISVEKLRKPFNVVIAITSSINSPSVALRVREPYCSKTEEKGKNNPRE